MLSVTPARSWALRLRGLSALAGAAIFADGLDMEKSYTDLEQM
jgi:hypothetical protein